MSEFDEKLVEELKTLIVRDPKIIVDVSRDPGGIRGLISSYIPARSYWDLYESKMYNTPVSLIQNEKIRKRLEELVGASEQQK